MSVVTATRGTGLLPAIRAAIFPPRCIVAVVGQGDKTLLVALLVSSCSLCILNVAAGVFVPRDLCFTGRHIAWSSPRRP